MTWTYRVFRDHVGRYSIREVFYNRDGSLVSYGKAPLALVGSSAEEVIQIIDWCKAAFDLPILTVEDVDAQLVAQPSAGPSTDQSYLSLKEVRAALAAESDPVES